MNDSLSAYRISNLIQFLGSSSTLKEKFSQRFLFQSEEEQTASETLFFEALHFLKQHDIPDIAFKAGFSVQTGSFGLLDFYLTSCQNLEQAIDALLRYFPLISKNQNSKIQFSSNLSKNHFTLNFDKGKSPDIESNSGLEICFFMSVFCNILQRLSTQDLTFVMQFPSQSLHSGCYEQLTSRNIQVKLKQAQFALSIPLTALKKVLPFANKSTQSFLEKELNQQLHILQQDDPLIPHIIQFISTTPLDKVSQHLIAEHFHMSESSLKRKLSELSTNLTQLMTQYKKEKSVQLLTSLNSDIDKISKTMGYSDRGAFERAFKGWFALSPSQFKQRSTLHRIAPDPISHQDINNIAPIPEICQRVISLTQSDDFSISDLANTITHDPVLTGRLMGVANSAFYGGQNITDLEQAIIKVLGVHTVRNLTITMMCCQKLDTSSCSSFDPAYFWKISLASAEMSKYFASAPQIKNRISPSELYLAALLHQVGLLAVAHLRPETTQEYLKRLETDELVDLTQLQNNLYGMTLAETAALVLTHWGLPQTVCQTISALDQIGSAPTSTLIRLLSNFLACYFQNPAIVNIPDMSLKLTQLTGLKESRIDIILERIITILPEIDGLSQQMTQKNLTKNIDEV